MIYSLGVFIELYTHVHIPVHTQFSLLDSRVFSKIVCFSV